MPKVVVTGICNACGKPFERKFYFESKEAALAWENSDSAKNQICEECDEERKNKRAAEHRIQMTANGGEPVEETAESNEEAKMNRAKELVEKYNFQLKMKEENETLVPSGNIYTVSVKQVTKDGTLDEIKSLKPEMLKILMDRYNQRQQQVYQC
jgi:hypothetical protein|nr:MAG TPA: trcl Probable zinc-ribbon domain [Caudoviricetes sp.]